MSLPDDSGSAHLRGEGPRETEIGLIPAGWEIRSIKELCDIFSGGTPRKAILEYWEGEIPWASGKDLKTPTLLDTIDHISLNGVNAGSRLAPIDSVFILVRGMGLAKDLPISVALRPMAFNQDVKALVSRNSLPGLFLRSAIYTAKNRLLSRMVPSAHGTMTLNLDDIETFLIGVPTDPSEAEAIAALVNLAQSAINAEQSLSNSCMKLKRAAMRELFARGLHGEAQKETEIGLVPTSWDVVDFASVRQWLQYGTSVRCGVEPTETPVLRIPNIEPGRVNLNDLKYCDLRAQEAQSYLLEYGDLVFIRTNGVLQRLGSCAVYASEPVRALFASYLIRARLRRDKIEPRFAAYFFGSERGTGLVAGRATPAADGKYNLNTGTIDSLPLPLPPTLDEQREIVAILDTIDQKTDLHKRKRVVLEELFKALLHKLMTGEIRVADLDLSALQSPAKPEVAA